jgi:hypothetical protein
VRATERRGCELAASSWRVYPGHRSTNSISFCVGGSRTKPRRCRSPHATAPTRRLSSRPRVSLERPLPIRSEENSHLRTSSPARRRCRHPPIAPRSAPRRAPPLLETRRGDRQVMVCTQSCRSGSIRSRRFPSCSPPAWRPFPHPGAAFPARKRATDADPPSTTSAHSQCRTVCPWRSCGSSGAAFTRARAFASAVGPALGSTVLPRDQR